MITTLKTLSALMLAIVLAGAPAYAQNADINLNGSVRVDDSIDAGVDTSVNAEADTSTSDMEDSNAEANSNSGVGFSLSRTDAAVTSSSGAMVRADSVNTASDLEAYAASTLSANESFDSVDASDDRITVRFTEEARLFGFIPHTVTSRVEVSADGEVRVVRPWYRFLVAGLSADTSAAIETRVRNAVFADGRAEGSFSARSQAVALAEVAKALGGSVDASASASSDATVNTNLNDSADVDAASEMEGALNVQPN